MPSNENRKQGNFRLTATAKARLNTYSKAVNYSQADFLMYLIDRYGKNAIKQISEDIAKKVETVTKQC